MDPLKVSLITIAESCVDVDMSQRIAVIVPWWLPIVFPAKQHVAGLVLKTIPIRQGLTFLAELCLVIVDDPDLLFEEECECGPEELERGIPTFLFAAIEQPCIGSPRDLDQV